LSGLFVLLLAATGSAFGAWAALRSRPPLWAAALAAFLFAVAGVAAVLATWIAGDGIALPGLQLSPGLKAWYFAEVTRDRQPWLDRALLVVAPLAHVLLLVARRDRVALLRPAPATALFVWLFLRVGALADEEKHVEQARGPDQVAYLTIVSRPGGARLILAAGDPDSSFLRVVHEHETASPPPRLHLHWTSDGEGLVVRAHEEEKPAFAVDLEGHATGLLPVEAREWPEPGGFVAPDVKQRFSQARRDVAEFIRGHGNLYQP
jgi:hypothetical protein